MGRCAQDDAPSTFPASDWEGVVWASNFTNLSGVKSVRLKPSILTPYGSFSYNSCTIALWQVKRTIPLRLGRGERQRKRRTRRRRRSSSGWC